MSNHNQRRIPTRTIAISGLLLALTIVMGFTPIGYIPVPPIKISMMGIPLLIGLYMEGRFVGLILALVYGLTSLIQAYTAAAGLFTIPLMNPLVSVLPRLCIMPVAYYTYKGINTLLKGKKQSLSTCVGAIAGSLTNTVGVLSMIYICYVDYFVTTLSFTREGLLSLLGSIALTNGMLEALLAALLIPLITGALNKALYAYNKPK